LESIAIDILSFAIFAPFLYHRLRPVNTPRERSWYELINLGRWSAL